MNPDDQKLIERAAKICHQRKIKTKFDLRFAMRLKREDADWIWGELARRNLLAEVQPIRPRFTGEAQG